MNANDTQPQPTPLTREAVLAMPAGSELDCWVDHLVMGGLPPHFEVLRRPYSTDIAAAWRAVEAMRKQGVFLSVHAAEAGYRCEAWTPGEDETAPRRRADGWEDCDADAAPLAICRCALLAALRL